MRIYLDNCCFNRPFDDQSQIKIHLETQAKLYIQQQIKNQALDLVWSYILDYENSFNPYEERQEIISEWRNFAKIDVSETDNLLENAEELTKLGIKAKDALHIACAMEAKCIYFLTTDAILLKKKPKIAQIELINPIDFVNL
ncbi:MAG: PIN domain-containing protein [Microscillaceae bacterium]